MAAYQTGFCGAGFVDQVLDQVRYTPAWSLIGEMIHCRDVVKCYAGDGLNPNPATPGGERYRLHQLTVPTSSFP